MSAQGKRKGAAAGDRRFSATRRLRRLAPAARRKRNLAPAVRQPCDSVPAAHQLCELEPTASPLRESAPDVRRMRGSTSGARRKRGPARIARRRLARAVVIVVVLVGVVVVAGAVESADSQPVSSAGAGGTSLGAAWQQQLPDMVDAGKRAYEAGSADAALARAGVDGGGSGTGAGAATLPESYRQAIAIPADAQGVHATDDCSVVGFWVPVAPEEASAAFAAEMELRGWTSVPLGDVPGWTFVGGAGEQSWAFTQFTSVAEGTSAVVVAAGLEDVDG